MHFAVTAAFLLPPEKALKKMPSLLGAYFLTPARVSSSKGVITGEFGALPGIPRGRRPLIVVEFVEFPIVASNAGLLSARRDIIQRGVIRRRKPSWVRRFPLWKSHFPLCDLQRRFP